MARWRLLFTIGCTIHALHHSSSLRALSYFVTGALLGSSLIFTAMKGTHKQVGS